MKMFLISTEDGIKQLGGVLMKYQQKFVEYLPADNVPEDVNIHIAATTSAGKCLPMVYLSNKKFAVTKYRVWSNLIFFKIVFSCWTKTIHRFRYVFDAMMSSKH